MTWSELLARYDADTQKILEISSYFLGHYFGHSVSDSTSMIAQLIGEDAVFSDPNNIHYLSSWELAAIAHYRIGLKGNKEKTNEWLLDTGYLNQPRSAAEYFKTNYYEKAVPTQDPSTKVTDKKDEDKPPPNQSPQP